MRIPGTLCDYCGRTYRNKDAIGYSSWWRLMRQGRPDEEHNFCCDVCLLRWAEELENPGEPDEISADRWMRVANPLPADPEPPWCCPICQRFGIVDDRLPNYLVCPVHSPFGNSPTAEGSAIWRRPAS